MKRRSVSITGVTGFLGWRLAEGFRDAGWQVQAVVRPGSRKALPDSVHPVEASLDRVGASPLARAFESSSAIVHCAALTRARRTESFNAVNVEGTRSIVEAANGSGAQLIFISSQAVAGGGTIDRPSREDDEPRPINAYGRSKLEAENVVRSTARVPWTILRPSAIYGPGDRQFLPLFRLASRGYSLAVANTSTAFTLIHVDDVVRAVMKTVDAASAPGQTLFLGDGRPATIDDILRSLVEAFDRPYRPWHVPAPVVTAVAALGEIAWMAGQQPILDRDRLGELRAGGFVCSVARARDVLGFTTEIGLQQGAAQTAQWYRRRGWV